MTYDDVISYYGTEKAAADAEGVKQPSVNAWKSGISMPRQALIQLHTKGKLKADPAHVKAQRAEKAEA